MQRIIIIEIVKINILAMIYDYIGASFFTYLHIKPSLHVHM